jgi:subtilase family serine protease
MDVGRRFLIAGTASALALSGALAAATPSGAQTRAMSPAGRATSSAPVRITNSAAAPLPRGAVRLGPLAPGSRLHLDVTLRVRDQAALTAFLGGLSDRHSPAFHHFLRRGQFGPRFGPTLAAVAAVRAALRRAGLSPGAVTPDRVIIPVTASAAAVEHAFGITLDRYRLPGGRVGFANTAAPSISGTVARYIDGVVGLDNLYLAHTMLARQSPRRHAGRLPLATGGHSLARPNASGPQPCSKAVTDGKDNGGYTANQLAGYYGMSAFYGLGDLGSGVRVALYELEPNSTSDISKYKSCYGVSTSVSYHKVDGGAGSGAGSGEAALDIEDVLGLAPDAAIDVYQAPNTNTAALDNYAAIFNADTDAVVSTSWGQCELLETQSTVSSEQTLFAQANSQGETVFAATGDTGSTGCLRSGVDKSSVSAGDPAAQPYVDGVGGTTVTSSAETVWNESAVSGGAGAGGVSRYWCMPSYQHQTTVPGLINSDSVKNSGCSTSVGKYVREEPDVTADADPYTGYVIYHSGTWSVIGGTSAAAPLWAAVAALIDDSPFCTDYASGDVGVLPQGLWAVAGLDHSYIYSGGADEPEIVKDITSGNDDYTPSGYTGGLYPATTGYDMASGLGSPLVPGVGSGGSISMFYPGLAAIMCAYYATKLTSTTVTGISPTSGSTAGGTKVTVTGTGFLPIAGADMAEVGTTYVAANCTSTSKCTIVTPAHAAGKVDIRITAEDFALSPVTSKDKYTYKS